MTREDVYKKLIDPRRDYQDVKWGGAEHDKAHEVGSWLTYMRYYMNLAEEEITTRPNDAHALERIVDVVALGVACLEYKK
jgi:hypothetical protein